jgi:hypothetical protein
MNTSLIYIAASIAILAITALLVFFLSRNRKINTLTPLAGLAFGFILAGIFFGQVLYRILNAKNWLERQLRSQPTDAKTAAIMKFTFEKLPDFRLRSQLERHPFAVH